MQALTGARAVKNTRLQTLVGNDFYACGIDADTKELKKKRVSFRTTIEFCSWIIYRSGTPPRHAYAAACRSRACDPVEHRRARLRHDVALCQPDA